LFFGRNRPIFVGLEKFTQGIAGCIQQEIFQAVPSLKTLH
jgi:hypothetical protein